MNVTRTSPLSPSQIAATGLRAQALRMNVIAANIANANTSKTASGDPYRRQQVVMSTEPGLNGVTNSQVVNDQSEFKVLYEPANPQADANGFVRMPNVDLPVEMMQMVSASRAYQANASVMKRYQDMVDATMELLK